MVHAPFTNESTSWNYSFCVAFWISIFWPVMSRNVILGKVAGVYDAMKSSLWHRHVELEVIWRLRGLGFPMLGELWRFPPWQWSNQFLSCLLNLTAVLERLIWDDQHIMSPSMWYELMLWVSILTILSTTRATAHILLKASPKPLKSTSRVCKELPSKVLQR